LGSAAQQRPKKRAAAHGSLEAAQVSNIDPIVANVVAGTLERADEMAADEAPATSCKG
jgi:hypothetical protein